MIYFQWDASKNVLNIKKHNVSFQEAATVFFDQNGLLIDDESHSDQEERFILIGVSLEGNVIVVCHCYRENDKIIRIISARKATKNERVEYEKGI